MHTHTHTHTHTHPHQFGMDDDMFSMEDLEAELGDEGEEEGEEEEDDAAGGKDEL